MSQTRQPSWEKFTQRDDDGAIFTVSLEIVLYTRKQKPELINGPIACYRQVLDRFRDKLDWYIASSMGRARRFSKKYVDIFPTLCEQPDKRFPLPFYRVFHGSGILDYLPPVFATLSAGDFSSFLQVHLPPAFGTNWKEILTLLAGLAEEFPFRYGHVGYSLCWNDLSVDRDIEIPELIGPLLKRYPGLSLGSPGELCDQDLPPVNWLTLIGPELLRKLGGVNKVRKAVTDDDISVMPLGRGICIRAGESPQLGDRNRKDDLPLYRKIGTYLKDYRGRPTIELTGLDEEESEAWLARFDS